jgi:hypothetical protein
MSDIELEGGAKVTAYLAALQSRLAVAKGVRVGFLEHSTYPEGDGGARLERAADRLTPAQKAEHPDWERKLRMWAASQAKVSPILHVAQVAFWNEFGTSTAPARPFFRGMVSKDSPEWGEHLGNYLTSSEFDAQHSLSLMGVEIRDALSDSITEWPADNSELTQHIKGFDKGLTDYSVMIRSTDFEVMT